MSQLLRFTGSVRRDRALDRWMTEHPGELGAIAKRWFEVIRSCGDDVRAMPLVIAFVAWTAALTMPACATRAPSTESHPGVEAAGGNRCASGARQDGGCDVYEVSLAELLTVPEKFHQKKVAVAGHLTLGFERNRLCERSGPGSCLWLAVGGLKKPGFRTGWAVVEGTFNRENRGHLGCCAGAIESISRITRSSR